MGQLEWAKKEIEIAMKSGDYDDYVSECYDSALRALESLVSDGHSGMSISITKHILNRFIDGKPLTPIEDTEDMWECPFTIDGVKVYQCARMGSLFKHVYEDGSVKYNDINRVVNVDIDSGLTFHSGQCCRYIDERFPITMPYYPLDKPYEVVTEDFLYKKPDAVGSFDHLGLLFFRYPDGREENIAKYYKESNGKLIEITGSEYFKHKKETEETA